MQIKILDNIARVFEVELPRSDSLDTYIDDYILPKVRPFSEDLREEEFFLNTPWLEFQDDENFHEAVLHFFHEGGSYLRCIDGD